MRRGRTGELTVARVMTKAALFEQMLMSGSTAMIFLTLDTTCDIAVVSLRPVSKRHYQRDVKERGGRGLLTRQLDLTGDLLTRPDRCRIVRHLGVLTSASLAVNNAVDEVR